MLEGLEIVPPRRMVYRDRTFEELDLEGVLGRHPEVALVDELAHTNVPGSTHAKRWEDAIDLLAAGVEVITTVNIQHLESLNDVVAELTGVRQRETVPDWVVDLADQVELVDMSPHALRRRMLHGNVYPDARKAELALQRFFTTDNLTALRELALMRVANQVDETLLSRWSKARVPETRERVLVCVSQTDLWEDLVRRGARIAQRARGDFLVVHVRGRDDEELRTWLGDLDRLVRDLGGELEVIDADDIADGVLGLAYRQFVTQLVIGKPLRSRWQELLHGSFVNRVIRRADNIDVHIIARPA
jgi:two-component system sensor histidine kinase KdpD